MAFPPAPQGCCLPDLRDHGIGSISCFVDPRRRCRRLRTLDAAVHRRGPRTSVSNNIEGILLALSSSHFIGVSFITKKKANSSSSVGVRAGN